ncbi:MAG: GNAT family N-acetyltransferase [Parvularculaceae bacterium]
MRRLARPQDLSAVHAIFMDARVNPHLGFEPMSVDAFQPIFERFLAGGAFHMFEERGRIASFYLVMRFSGRGAHVAELGALAIDPALQGSGVAARMMEDALARLREEGVTRVELRTDAGNLRGLAFYRKMGFEVEGVLKKAFKRQDDPEPIDDVLLVRFLER